MTDVAPLQVMFVSRFLAENLFEILSHANNAITQPDTFVFILAR